MGAYMQLFTPAIPGFGLILMAGAYNAQAIEFEQIAVFTNKVATDAYRGAGRPEAAYAIERLMDTIAGELHLDPAEVRRRNFCAIFRGLRPLLLYDSGNYQAALDKALAMVTMRRCGRSNSAARAGALPGDWPRVLYRDLRDWPVVPPTAGMGVGELLIRVEPTGMVTVLTGASPHGQGSETTYAQLVADALGVPLDHIEVVHGNTDVVPTALARLAAAAWPWAGRRCRCRSRKSRTKPNSLPPTCLTSGQRM